MPWLQQWNQVRAVTGRIDLAFLFLRVFSLFGGVAWLLLMELPPREESLLIKALLAFFLYSLLCYLVIFFRPLLLKKVYLTSLFLDLTFLSLLVHADPSLSSSFFLGYYLLICLHTIYFGLRFGLVVATLSALLYLLSIWSVLPEIDWTDLVMRLGFLFFLAIPVGLLSEKLKEEKEQVEHLNQTLENRVAQRTAEIAALLEQERYLRQILDTVAHINKLLITAPALPSLLASACARFTQHGDYRFCWIGLLENGAISEVYSAEPGLDALPEPPYRVDAGNGPLAEVAAAACLRENRTIIRMNDGELLDETLWRDPEPVRGARGVISLPLRARQGDAPLGCLVIYTWRADGFEAEEREMLDELAGDIGFAVDSFRQRELTAQLTAERAANYEETIFSFVDLIEQRDTYTAGHTERVAHYSSLLARELNLSQAEKKRLYTAAMLHDIGKIATPDSVLLKPGKLTELDYELIKLHPRAGYEMLSNIEMYKDLAKIILHHHERPDGNGYPNGLAGEEIPLLSRIMAVADAFDAMTTNRIYKGRKQLSQALAELQELAGSQFDAKVVAAATRVLAEVDLPSRVSQLPFTELEKKRFSYFFNDRLTGLYNEDYLKIVLNNLSSNHFSCLYLLHLRNLPEYNKRVGWEKGNQLFTRFAAELQAAFPACLVFRAYGNDFAVISREHLPLNSNLLKAFAGISSTEIEIDVRHVDLAAEQLYTIEKLEKLEVTPADEL
ncbi:HD domain-containing phosphohydrolase [Desulfurivibrio alkaliphilus]|uniref:Metal dependent phosphohydrolase n=1 Tax=Desulfurivibrio alkaliphilus (strain DSM 19089 / UNIQEM U267 / AHT2) TaxID=589865 RepID=D6Z5L1_DESAT|nr:HD domain-containing phosphohydrolase [Desulfurivibrio alkaliphilus]ADH86748.1 metal dependent phosphohydrolase [Desulfurivibrio alkaliphilus AHT 2]